jgi:RNA polymerase sigma-70 factor (ECF subfamily)
MSDPSPEEQQTLEVLMARLADGDRSVFSAVFKRLWTPTELLCRTLLGNEADAADAAQLAMTKILGRASDYDRTRPAMPWALAIAAWECRTLRRKRTRRAEVSDDAVAEPAGADLEGELVRRDLIQAAARAMGTLSVADQETLTATFWGEPLPVSGPTLRKRRERAVDRLRAGFRRLYGLD